MATQATQPLSVEGFCQLIATELQLDPGQVTPQSSLINDLLVDSVRMVELMLRLEEMGITIPPEAAWEIETVEDAYRCYQQAACPSEQAGNAVAPTPL